MEVREFLEQLCEGVRQIPKKHHALFYALQKLDSISKKEKGFFLKEGFALGCIDVARKDLVFLKSFSSKHTKDFRVLGDLRALRGGEIALVKLASRSTRARLVSILYLPMRTQLVFLEDIKGKRCALALKSMKDKPLMISLKARQKALNALPLHTVLEVDVRDGEILEVLGVLEDESIDEKIVLRSYGKTEEFPQECLKLAQSFGQEVYKEVYPSRRDLTNLPFCTIDPSDAKDHDDAIFFDTQSQSLYVAIADVAEYVSKESSLDNEARRRGFSLYLPHKSIPMLPRALSENICSLREGELRLALVWEMRLDSQGEVLESKLYEAMIRNHQNLSYEQVEEWLTKKPPKNLKKPVLEIIASLLELDALLKKRRKNRLKKGYTFKGEELKCILDSQLRLQEVLECTSNQSHHLVEEAMLLANVESAKMLQNLKVCGLYRVHQKMKEIEFFDLVSDLRLLGFEEKLDFANLHQSIAVIQEWAKQLGLEIEVDRMLIRAQNQAQYSSENIGHFGLGFEAYTHFTSPIRRYSDLCVHRLLKELIHGGKRMQYLSQDFPLLCKNLNILEREADKVEMDYRDRKFAHWANRKRGERLRVSVVDEQYPPLCVALEKIKGARVVVRTRESLQKFDEFEVELDEVHLANARIYAQKV